MSSPRRARQRNRNSTPAARPPEAFSTREGCGCPECSGEDFDPRRLIDELTAGGADLVAAEDPLDAEVAGATFVSIGDRVGEEFTDALIGGFIPAFEERATTEALAMVLAIGSVADDRVGKVASAAADRLVEVGVSLPSWAAELGEPVTVTDCWQIFDSQDTASMLVGCFQRAGRSHAVVVSVDHLDCGAAMEILLFDGDTLPAVLETIRVDRRDRGVEITQEPLGAAEFRWQVEAALGARAVHDRERAELGDDPPVGDEFPDYRTLAVLLHARMGALPLPSTPPALPGAEDGNGGAAVLGLLARLLEAEANGFGAVPSTLTLGTASRRGLPAKRTGSDGTAPIYQIKVGLRGAKPPIWRRLEVPADISLAHLHTVIQVAFGWYDSHLHVFETACGEFGVAEAELGHQPEAPVTLEQVAPEAKSKIRYTYDFGDDWEHDILVEKIIDRDEAVSYPRCTGGRRAAPPEDCGGIWGYTELIEILGEDTHPEHNDALRRLGLDDASDFDPTEFDAATVDHAMSRLR